MRVSTFVVFVFVRLYFVLAKLMNDFDKCNTMPRFFCMFFCHFFYCGAGLRGEQPRYSLVDTDIFSSAPCVAFFRLLVQTLRTAASVKKPRRLDAYLFCRENKGLRS